MSATEAPPLELQGAGKRYGDAVVLSGFDIALRPGVVHGLIGRNGAGKSTAVGILTGRHAPDMGTILVDGKPTTFPTPGHAQSAGIVAVPQEIVLPLGMAIREVVTLGSEPAVAGVVRRGHERRRVETLLGDLGVHVDVEMDVAKLPMSSQKIVLVAQQLYRQARVIALDEPTSAMNPEDAERVCQLVETLRRRGLAILYISHRLEEVERLCQVVTVLADGRNIANLGPSEIEKSHLVRVMMPQALAGDAASKATRVRAPAEAGADDATLQVDSASSGLLENFHLEVTPGSIVGVAGLPGSGVEDAFGILCGRSRPAHGGVRVGDHRITSSRSAVRSGIAFLPASRRDVTMVLEGVVDNMILNAMSRSSRGGFLTSGRARSYCRRVAESLGLTPVMHRRIGKLSGGNQQRALVAGRLLAQPRFLVLEDPTVGVDIHARQELHAVLQQLAADGMGIVVGSSDPDELVELCDRVVVIRRGEVVADLEGYALNDFRLTSELTGGRVEPEKDADNV